MEVTLDLLIRAYAAGLFPMARSRDEATLQWVDPEQRGILPLDAFHVSRSLRKVVRRGVFEVTCDTDFAGVLDGCAEATHDRPDTWINPAIRHLFTGLFELGLAHSLETRTPDGTLVGGLYGLALGSAFFGESMFSRCADASKVALVHLVARLKAGGFTLLDTQFVTDHLRQFGAVEIPRRDYHQRLQSALETQVRFPVTFGNGGLGQGDVLGWALAKSW